MNSKPCPGLEQCDAYVAGTLAHEEHAAVAAHLERCATCRALVDDVRADSDLLSDVRSVWNAASRSAQEFTERDRIQIVGYAITGLLHEGGQGAVYEAVQQSTQRRVAIKVLLRGRRATARELHRFEREVELASRLDHPNIVTIFDSGRTDDGRPYFVMALVDGHPLDRHVRAAAMPLGTTLRLFVKIADAVSYAHRHAVVHRDLKPSNVVIDAAGEPHLLDFGLAKAVDELEPQRASVQTRSGEFVGTIAYAAPEQVLGDPDAIDTRTDVYALGVMLYELLARRLPYDISATSIASAARVIAEEDPIPLSETARTFRGDLSTIVQHALRKAPSQRYQAAADLADDVRRFLNHEPILARPASTSYQLRKFARRHPSLVAAVVVLVASTGVAVWQASRLHAEARTREAVAGFLRDVLTSIDPARARGNPPTVRELIDDASRRLATAFPDSPEVRTELHETLGRTYFQLGAFEPALVHYRHAHDGRVAQRGFASDESMLGLASIGLALRELDRLEEAEALLRDGLARSPDRPGPARNALLTALAIVLDELGREEEASDLYRQVYERARDRAGPVDREVLLAQNNLGKHLIDLRRFDEARPLVEDCVARRRTTLGDDHPDTLVTMSTLAALQAETDHLDEAIATYAELVARSAKILGPSHRVTLQRRLNWIRTLWRNGDAAAAIEGGAALVSESETTLDRTHADSIAALEVYTAMLAGGDRSSEARTLAMEWFRDVESALGARHRNTARVARLLAHLFDAAGDEEEAAVWAERGRGEM